MVLHDVCALPQSRTESRSEKPARGALLSAMQRHANAGTVLIVDAPNYIKGFRYQMYCIARELRLRVCTVRIVAPFVPGSSRTICGAFLSHFNPVLTIREVGLCHRHA